MRPMLYESSHARSLRVARSVVVLGLAALADACSEAPDGSSGDFVEHAVGGLEQALFDSDDIRVTAGSAMVAAYDLTLANGDRFEYCGLIVRKANQEFRAGEPVTTRQAQFCGASIGLGAGESVVGYYHTHTGASVPQLSDGDITEAEATGREYFVLSTVTGCGEQYSPSTNIRTNLGCPF